MAEGKWLTVWYRDVIGWLGKSTEVS